MPRNAFTLTAAGQTGPIKMPGPVYHTTSDAAITTAASVPSGLVGTLNAATVTLAISGTATASIQLSSETSNPLTRTSGPTTTAAGSWTDDTVVTSVSSSTSVAYTPTGTWPVWVRASASSITAGGSVTISVTDNSGQYT